MKKFNKYLMKSYLNSLVAIMIFILIIYTFFQVVQHTKYISRYNTPFLNILIFDLMKIPYSIYQVFPVAASAAIVVTMLKLIKNNELIAYLSFGGRLRQIAILFLSVNFLFFLILLYYSDAINPKIEKIRAIYKDEKIFFQKHTEKLTVTDFYFKDKGNIISIDLINFDKKEFDGVTIYEKDKDTISFVKRAKKAKYLGNNIWEFQDFKIFDVKTIPTLLKTYNKYKLKSKILTKFIKIKPDEPKKLSFKELSRVIKVYESKGLSAESFRLIYYNKIAVPLILIVLTILLLPLSITISRSYQYIKVAVKSLSVTIIFWVSYSVFYSLGKNGVINPFLANFSMHILFFIFGMIILLSKERGF